MPRIGAFELHAIDAGTLRLDGGAMFGIVPRSLWQRKLQPDNQGRITLQMRCLLLEGEGRLVLVDTGAGLKAGPRFREWFALEAVDPGEAIKQAGYSPNEVTDVVLTHLHFDHAGGATMFSGDTVVPRFKNAAYYVQQSQLESAQAPNAREAASFLQENFEPLLTCGQLHTLDGAHELLSGVNLTVIHGHTQSQQLVRVDGPECTLVFAGDLIPTVHHLPLPWIMAYDVRPLVTIAEKRALLDEAVEKDLNLFFAHDPDIAVGNVEYGSKGPRLVRARPLSEL